MTPYNVLQMYHTTFKQIDWFTNIFKFDACLFNKGCSWQPESLPEVLPDIATSNATMIPSIVLYL